MRAYVSKRKHVRHGKAFSGGRADVAKLARISRAGDEQQKK
jgi:hypothetical protein